MNISYFLGKSEREKFEVIFCPDREGLRIKKKFFSYTTIAKDLKKFNFDRKLILVLDRRISKKVTKYLIHDLKISFSNLVILKISGNKTNKNTKTLFKILNTLFKEEFTKKSVLISCGGGVIGDVSGLASSLYLRGLIHFHIPTTMTAIIDSCLGGKTGVNYRGIINSLGTYYHPKKVYISKNVIKLIPDREYLAGIPEIIKCGLIDNIKILKALNQKDKIISRDFKYISQIIKSTLETKIKYFKNDVTENNKRLNLNFGHTFAHAIEMSLDSLNKTDSLRHGEAVGIGILCEIFYKNGKNNSYNLVEKLLKLYKLPTNLKNIINKKNIKNLKNLKEKIFKNIFLDKKKINNYPRYVNLVSVGKSKITEMKDFKRIKETINQIIF